MSELLSLGFGILVVLLITVATGYFVAQEFAYMAVNRSRLGSQASRGDDQAARTLASALAPLLRLQRQAPAASVSTR